MTSPSQSQPVSGPTAPVTEAEASAAGMVEGVARVLCRQANAAMLSVEAATAVSDSWWRDYIPAARAAIAAMREPTARMVKVADYNAAMSHSEVSGAVAGWLYTTMIDAALAEDTTDPR